MASTGEVPDPFVAAIATAAAYATAAAGAASADETTTAGPSSPLPVPAPVAGEMTGSAGVVPMDTTTQGAGAATDGPSVANAATNGAVEQVTTDVPQDMPVGDTGSAATVAANDCGDNAPAAAAAATAADTTADTSAPSIPSGPKISISTDWGGSRALSGGEEDALLLSEFLREYWSVFASSTAPVLPKAAMVAAATVEESEAGEKHAAAKDGSGTRSVDAGDAAAADDAVMDEARSNEGNADDDDDLPIAEAQRQQKMAAGDTNKAGGDGGGDISVVDGPSGPRKPPTITPRVVQDAARILAERERRMYHVAEDCASDSDKTGKNTIVFGDENNAADVTVPDLVDEDHAAAVCDMEQTLLRLGVLGTKALAEDVLVVRPQKKSYTASGKRKGRKAAGVDAPDLDRVTHFSALLNLPGSDHFCQLLGPVDLGCDAAAPAVTEGSEEDRWHHRALPLPPNLLTYQSYLRLALMASCLSSDDDMPGSVPEPILQACKSPLCAFLPSLSIGSDLRPTRGIEHSHAKGRDSDDGGGGGGGGGKRKQPVKIERDASHGSAGWKWARTSDAQLLSGTSSLTGSDIVALWIRAQRNTGAWRQLLGMFRFVVANADNNSAVTSSCDFDSEDPSAPTYRAVYVGNHINASSREDESKRVDALVTWAATNQVLFTWESIRNELAVGIFPELGHSGKKRRGGKAVGLQSGKSAKRSSDDTPGHPVGDDADAFPAPDWMEIYNKPLTSRISSTGSQLPDNALMALQSYAIRLLAAMHRPILTVLFTSKPDSFLSPDDNSSPSQQLLSRLVGQNLPSKIKDEMRKSRSTSDRTLARIDRRLATGKYIPDEGDEVCEKRGIHYHFYDLVRFVFKSLRHSLDSTDEASRAAVTEAIEDWSRIRELYLNSDESKNCWAMSGWLSMSPVSIQSALSAPWAESEKCQVCNEDIPSNSVSSDDTLICCCCATSFVHSKCQPNESVESRSLSSLLHSYTPLRQVYSLRSPAGVLPIPDYTKPHLRNTIKWSRQTITLNRPIVPGERPPGWGLSINHLETASEALDKVLEQTFDVTKFSCPDTTDAALGIAKELGTPILVRLPCPPELTGESNKDGWRAILIGTVRPDTSAERAGVRVGDIVVAMDLNPTLGDDAPSASEAPSKNYYDLSDLMPRERVDLFKKHDVSAVKLHIYRPENVDFAKQGKEFLEKAVQLSMPVMGLYKGNKDKALLTKHRWRCSECRSSQAPSSAPTSEEARGKSRSRYNKAFCCRSVIRRLAVEWYARPFVDEGHRQNHSATAIAGSKAKLPEHSHDFCISLRRLDGMFSSIMEEHADVLTVDNTKLTESGAEEVSPFFYTPPSPSSRASRERLEWAPVELEADPFSLLCKGMSLLLSSALVPEGPDSNDGLLREQKTRLARHFLPLFSSYCLDSSIDWETQRMQGDSGSGSSNGRLVFQGPPDTIVAHCPPFLRQPCSCCGVRPTEDSTLAAGFCSENCEASFEQGWLIRSDPKPVSSEEEPKDPALSKEEGKCRMYDINSSVVGSTVLVLPDDPLFDTVCQMVGLAHEHCGRPLEMIVASYLPFDFVGVAGLSDFGVYGDSGFAEEQQGREVPGRNNKSDKASFLTRPEVVDEGIFQLIPVLNSKQLTYVESKCGLRKPPQKSTSTQKSSTRAAKEQWTDLSVLQLHGIVHLSVSEMRYRLDKTAHFCSAIDSAVAHMASIYGGKSIDERVKENIELLDTKEINPLGDLGLEERSRDQKLRRLFEFSSTPQSAPQGVINAIHSLGHPDLRSITSHQAQRLNHYSALADTMTYRGIDIIQDAPSRDGGDGYDTDIDEDAAIHLASLNQGSALMPGQHLSAQKMIVSAESCALASPKASGGYLLLLEPTNFEEANDYTVCYSDLILFKGDVKKMSGISKSVSLARRLELEKEKMGQLQSTEPSHLTIKPPSFCRVNEKQLLGAIPKRRIVEFGVDPQLERIGGRFDVILHRLAPGEKASVDGESSDDEWDPDKEETKNTSDGTGTARSVNEFKGRGWGFELVRWRMDLGRVLRVGRVHPASPASRAGLLPNDIILSINGKAASTLITEGALARELIATSYGKDDRPAGNHYIIDLLSKHKALGGPIALQVLRVIPGVRRTSSQSRSPTPSHSRGTLTPPPGDEASASSDLRRLDQEIARVETEDARNSLQQQEQQLAQQRQQAYQAAAAAAAQQREQERQRQRTPAVSQRPALVLNDLYKQGAPNSIFTRAETSVLLEAIERRLPKLGIRLLMPRYPRKVVHNEFRVTIPSVIRAIRENTHLWPKISDPIWKRLTEADYTRSLGESGDIVDQEPDPSNPINSYQYTEPIQVLAIDRLLEKFLEAERIERERQEEELRRRRQEDLQRRQEQERVQRERAQQEAAQAQQQLLAIEQQRRQLAQQEAQSRRVLARAHLASTGAVHQQPVAASAPLQAQPNAYAPSRHQQNDYHHQQVPVVNNPSSGQGGFVDLTDEGQGSPGASGTSTDELQRIRGGGDSGERQENEDAPSNDEGDTNNTAKASVTPADGYPLSRIDRSGWKGFVVIGKCHTRAELKNGQCSMDTTYFLGILNANVPLTPSSPDHEMVSVLVFYLAQKNLFLPVDGAIETQIEAGELFAAYENSTAEHVYDEWVQRTGQDIGVKFFPARGPSSNRVVEPEINAAAETMHVGTVTDEPKMSGREGDDREDIPDESAAVSVNNSAGADDDDENDDDDVQILETVPAPKEKMPLRTAADILVKRLSHRSASLLGYLPDGRAVVWLKSDPEAIYLRFPASSSGNFSSLTDDISHLQYVATSLDQSDAEDNVSKPSTETSGPGFSCVWGCCSSSGVSPKERFSSSNDKKKSGDQVAKDQFALSYDTQEELASHLCEHHSYIDAATFHRKSCSRISQGEAIIRLCADLSLAFCARCPGLIDSTVPLSLSFEAEAGDESISKHIIFDFQRNLDLSQSGEGSLNFSSIAIATRECPEVRDMIRLVSRLCRLFAVEKGGEYRLTLPKNSAEEDVLITSGDIGKDADRSMSFDDGEAALLSSIERDIEASQPPTSGRSETFDKKVSLSMCGVECFCTSIDHSNDYTNVSDRARCPICAAKGEGVIAIRCSSAEIERNEDTDASIDENNEPAVVPSGIGCALLSDFPKYNPSSRLKTLRDAKIMAQIKAVHNEGKNGQLKALKVMLLTIARRVPPSLYAESSTPSSKSKPSALVTEDSANGGSDSAASVSLWEDDNFHQWISFVRYAENERMLALAFLLLINSVNKHRMPNWWTAKKSGWSSPMTTLHFQTLSSLALNFYVFDAAVLDGSPSVSDGALLGGSNSANNQGSTSTSGAVSLDKRPAKKTKKGGPQRWGDSNTYFEKLKKMNFPTRMKTALKWADKCGIQRLPPNEDHNDVCAVCKEGGDLICCELCCQSMHPECLNIRGGGQNINFDEIDFVCEQCQLDTTCHYEGFMEGN